MRDVLEKVTTEELEAEYSKMWDGIVNGWTKPRQDVAKLLTRFEDVVIELALRENQ